MSPLDLGDARAFLDAVIAAFAVLGGVMAYASGFEAARARLARKTPRVIGDHISVGVANGFIVGAAAALITLILVL